MNTRHEQEEAEDDGKEEEENETMATSLSWSSSLHISTREGATSTWISGRSRGLPASSCVGVAFSPHASSVTSPTSISETKDARAIPSSPQLVEEPSSSASTVKDWKSKGSAQLTRWARARKLRSGKPSLSSSETILSPASEPSTPHSADGMASDMHVGHEDHCDMSSSFLRHENTVYMVSDGTGWTAEHSVHAALGQFEHCLVDHGCPVSTHLFSEINDVERLMEIIQDAGKERAILVYTLADPSLAEAAKKACELHGIPHLDIFGPITELLSTYLGVTPSGLPRGAPGRKTTLSKQYFKRIEAVEFTIKQDDGALPKNLHKADMVLVGVSRTSKTPLSTYIAQKGYKVANVPLVLGIEPPRELFEIDQSKIFALTINPNFLHSIRTARSKSLGVSFRTSYNDMDHIKKELDFSKNLFVQNPKWPVIEVTGKAIEETAAVILRIYHDRERKYVMPRISRRY